MSVEHVLLPLFETNFSRFQPREADRLHALFLPLERLFEPRSPVPGTLENFGKLKSLGAGHAWGGLGHLSRDELVKTR